MNKLKLILAWCGGIVSMYFVYSLFEKVSKVIGVPIEILLEEPMTVDYGQGVQDEIDIVYTGFGYAAMFISMMIAWRIGKAINVMNIRGAFKKSDEYVFFAWLFGLITYGISSAALYMLTKDFNGSLENIASILMEVFIIYFIFNLFKKWLNKNLEIIEKESRDS